MNHAGLSHPGTRRVLFKFCSALSPFIIHTWPCVPPTGRGNRQSPPYVIKINTQSPGNGAGDTAETCQLSEKEISSACYLQGEMEPTPPKVDVEEEAQAWKAHTGGENLSSQLPLTALPLVCSWGEGVGSWEEGAVLTKKQQRSQLTIRGEQMSPLPPWHLHAAFNLISQLHSPHTWMEIWMGIWKAEQIPTGLVKGSPHFQAPESQPPVQGRGLGDVGPLTDCRGRSEGKQAPGKSSYFPARPQLPTPAVRPSEGKSGSQSTWSLSQHLTCMNSFTPGKNVKKVRMSFCTKSLNNMTQVIQLFSSRTGIKTRHSRGTG